MPDRRPSLVIVGGQVWAETGQWAEQLAEAAERTGRRPDVLVWDDQDVDHRWQGRPATFVVRDRPLRMHSARAAAAELRSYLWRRRHADVVLVGRVALEAAPWLQAHRGRRAWLPTIDDLGPLADGLVIPPAASGGPHHVVTTQLELARAEPVLAEPRQRWAPGFWASTPTAPARAEILAWGPPDRRQGFDLVGRALAVRAQEMRAASATVRWLAPLEAGMAADEADDLHRAGVGDLLVVQPVTDPEATMRAQLPGAAALLVCGRPGAWTAQDETLCQAFRFGVQVSGFGPPAAPALALEERWRTAPFGDVTTLAAALVDAVGTPGSQRFPGPIGIEALFRHLDGSVPRG